MKTVWKFPIPIPTSPVFEMQIPKDADILCVQTQYDFAEKGPVAMLWALVETENQKATRKFLLVGTGWDIGKEISIPERLYHPSAYVGTFQVDQPHATLVFHLFEVIEQ